MLEFIPALKQQGFLLGELVIIDAFPEANLFWNDDLPKFFLGFPSWPIHSFVFYKGKYYDAETPNGIDDPSLLPRFKSLTNTE